MYAIVDIAGQQFKVKKDQKVYVHRLEAEEGAKVEFDKVLLVENEGKIDIGVPTVDGVRVAVKVLTHLKGDKVIVFKKKRRKGYQKSNGHRQALTQILVQGILAKGEILKETAEAAPKPKKVKAEASAEEKPKKAKAKKAAKETEE